MRPQAIAHYQITAKLGEGGMGEVYRATDTKLGREVAIKVLPESFAQDPDRVARFTREAQVLASLNHPHIAAIYGFEERALVMELVEGQTLADRLARGPVPLEEALGIAQQIAGALEAAHEKGITHRDLKPANVKVTPDGVVKVLDFGLAKLAEPDVPAGNATISPTITMRATQVGVLLGTAAYMSPEQARGKPVDKRADIWAFGVLLYEMITGRPLFQGEDVSHTLASVIMKEPDLSAVPSKVRPILKRCLEKDPKRRLRDISGFALLLGETAEAETAAAVPSRTATLAWIAAGLCAVIAAGLAFVHFRERRTVAEPILFQIQEPDKARFATAPPAISPDGRRLAFIASDGGQNYLWVRSLDTLDAHILAGTEGVNTNTFFWSPDSRFLGFAQGGRLRKVDLSGAPPQTVSDLPSNFRGGAWAPGGEIVFGVANKGLFRVPEAGAAPSPLTKVESARGEIFHTTPSFLPDGQHFIYLRQGTVDVRGIYVGSLALKPEQQSTKRLLAADGIGVFTQRSGSRRGYILFLREGSLLAQPFNPQRLELAGDAVPIARNVGSNFQNSWFSVSANGTLVYRSSTGGEGRLSQLAWFDRSGKSLGAVGEPGGSAVSLSPDETRVAIQRTDAASTNTDLWLHEFARGITTRFTFDPAVDALPVWSPDGKYVAFDSGRQGTASLYRKLASGAGQEETLLESKDNKSLQDWSRDGRFLIYVVTSGDHSDLWLLPTDGEKNPRLYLKTRFFAYEPRFSPDTRFVAYSSTASGRSEIYVQTFPDPAGGQWLVSQGGGAHPRWRRDGKELYYISADSKLMAVDVTLSPTFKAGIPKALFAAPILGGASDLGTTRYDVSADGQRFLIMAVASEVNAAIQAPAITVLLNWEAALKK